MRSFTYSCLKSKCVCENIHRKKVSHSNCTFFDMWCLCGYLLPNSSFLLPRFYVNILFWGRNCECRVPLVKGKGEWGMNAPLQVVRLRKIRFKCLDVCPVEKDATGQQTSFKSEHLSWSFTVCFSLTHNRLSYFLTVYYITVMVIILLIYLVLLWFLL